MFTRRKDYQYQICIAEGKSCPLQRVQQLLGFKNKAPAATTDKLCGIDFQGKDPFCAKEQTGTENAGVDPATSHMQSERSTIWANSPQALPTGEVFTSSWKLNMALLTCYPFTYNVYHAEFPWEILSHGRGLRGLKRGVKITNDEQWVFKAFNKIFMKRQNLPEKRR